MRKFLIKAYPLLMWTLGIAVVIRLIIGLLALANIPLIQRIHAEQGLLTRELTLEENIKLNIYEQFLKDGLTHRDFLIVASTIKNWDLTNREEWNIKGIKKYTLTSRQLLWKAKLELCESGGNPKAVNPNDLDNTPSYYSFQFKPDTFRGYAIQYGLLPNDLEYEDYFNWMADYDLQSEIVTRMIGDKGIPDNVWRYTLFPGCTAINGTPPRI